MRGEFNAGIGRHVDHVSGQEINQYSKQADLVVPEEVEGKVGGSDTVMDGFFTNTEYI